MIETGDHINCGITVVGRNDHNPLNEIYRPIYSTSRYAVPSLPSPHDFGNEILALGLPSPREKNPAVIPTLPEESSPSY